MSSIYSFALNLGKYSTKGGATTQVHLTTLTQFTIRGRSEQYHACNPQAKSRTFITLVLAACLFVQNQCLREVLFDFIWRVG